jgi:hypothetical protein
MQEADDWGRYADPFRAATSVDDAAQQSAPRPAGDVPTNIAVPVT